jgi:hypothetical protein
MHDPDVRAYPSPHYARSTRPKPDWRGDRGRRASAHADPHMLAKLAGAAFHSLAIRRALAPCAPIWQPPTVR